VRGTKRPASVSAFVRGVGRGAEAAWCGAAQPEEVEEVKKLDLEPSELHALAEAYAARYGARLSEILL